MLEVQHRMRPDISEFIRAQTYPTLKDHPTVFEYPHVRGVAIDVLFVDHDEVEDNANDLSEGIKTTKANSYEAHMVVKIAKHFLLQGYRHDQVTILTPYVGQIIKILKVMKAIMMDVDAYVSELDREDLLRNAEDGDELAMDNGTERNIQHKIRCASIDNFQGEESDIIIVSLVRSNTLGNIGFLKEEQRVNVLMSRARHGLYLIGNSTTLKRSSQGAHVWNPILASLTEKGSLLRGFPTVCEIHPNDGVTLISNPSDFEKTCPNGGCLRPCKVRMNCGHVCSKVRVSTKRNRNKLFFKDSPHFLSKACHPTDKSHVLAHKQCCEPCRRFPPECKRNHACQKLCKDDCGPCTTIMEPIKLPCGHVKQNPQCHDVRNEDAIMKLSRKCTESVIHTFRLCGHSAETPCRNALSQDPECPLKCGKILDCGHACVNR